MPRLVRALLLSTALLLPACADEPSPGEVSFRVVLHHPNNSRPYMPLPEEVAKQVAGDLEEVGFEVELRTQEWATYLEMVQAGEHQLALLGWSADVPDPDNFLYVLLDKTNARKGSAQNISFYTSEEAHGLLEEARYTYEPARRADLYAKAQRVIHRDVPMVPLVFTSQFIAHRSEFGPLAPQPTMHPLLRLCERPRDGTLRFVRGSDSAKLDPANVTDGESSNVIEQVFEGLVRFVPDGTEVEPCLAVSWTHSEDARRWTFRIRPDVRFHDGTPLTPAAVVAAFERQRDESHPHHVRGGDFAYWKDLLAPYVERVEEGPGADEVTFRCSRPAPAHFTATLAAFAFGIPSPAALAKHGEAFAQHPVGTGPFRFVSWNLGSKEILLQRFDEHWEAKPALARVLYQVSEDATARSQRLLSGGADVIDNLAPETIADLRAAQGVTVVERPGLNIAYLAMNNERPPFDDPRVREAVALAIDKERIVRAAYAGHATAADTPLPPTVAGGGERPAPRPRDPARARALLDEVRRSPRPATP